MRDILVLAEQAEPWANSVRYAGLLASSLHARRTGLCCPRADPAAIVAGHAAPVIAGAATARDAFAMAREKEAAFRSYASSLGARHAAWIVHDGCAVKALARLAQWHDLLVLGRQGTALHPDLAMGRLQLVARVPSLVVPEQWEGTARPACVAVVWDGSLSSIRALHAAIDLLERAQRVVLLVGGRRGVPCPEPGLPSFDLDLYCERHELLAGHIALGDDWSGASVLRGALAAGADLLVMAAHGRTRMSNRLLDRDSLHVLRHSPLPLMLCH
jgi:nucleotide-binding universal stress UspA family protein